MKFGTNICVNSRLCETSKSLENVLRVLDNGTSTAMLRLKHHTLCDSYDQGGLHDVALVDGGKTD